jgi:hypothetical protein
MKPTTKKSQPETANPAAVEILPPQSTTFEVHIIGITPLMVHRWSEKAKREMRDKQTKGIKAKKELKIPEQDYQDAMYRDPTTGREGFSAPALRAATVDAATFVETVSMKYLKGSIFVEPDFRDEDGTPCVLIDGKSVMREDMVRLSGIGSTADLRYRPIYEPWGMRLRVQYDAGLLTPNQVVNLLNRAGFSIGIGEWRPSSPKGKSGTFGRFRVVSKAEYLEAFGPNGRATP